MKGDPAGGGCHCEHKGTRWGVKRPKWDPAAVGPPAATFDNWQKMGTKLFSELFNCVSTRNVETLVCSLGEVWHLTIQGTSDNKVSLIDHWVIQYYWLILTVMGEFQVLWLPIEQIRLSKSLCSHSPNHLFFLTQLDILHLLNITTLCIHTGHVTSAVTTQTVCNSKRINIYLNPLRDHMRMTAVRRGTKGTL